MTHQTRLRGPAALAALVFAISFVVALFMLVVSMAAPTLALADDVAPATLATALVITVVATFAISTAVRRPDETPIVSFFCLAFDGTKIVLDYVAIAVNWADTVVFRRQTLAVNIDDPGGGTTSGGNHRQMITIGSDGRHDDVPIDRAAAMRWDKALGEMFGDAVNRSKIRDDGAHEMYDGQPALAGT